MCQGRFIYLFPCFTSYTTEEARRIYSNDQKQALEQIRAVNYHQNFSMYFLFYRLYGEFERHSKEQWKNDQHLKFTDDIDLLTGSKRRLLDTMKRLDINQIIWKSAVKTTKCNAQKQSLSGLDEIRRLVRRLAQF